MSLDHLNEEGLAEAEEIEIPLSIILFFSILLIISYGIHFNGHFHIFGLLARILFWIYKFWTIMQDVLFYWYFLLHSNYDIRQKETSSDSTQSRDQQIDQKILPEVPVPDTEVLGHIRPQINFPWNSCIDEIPNIVTFTGNITHIVQNFINLSLNASIPHIFDPPKLQQDKQLGEFLRGEICCQNFINQDLTFLQLSVIHVTQPKEDSILPEVTTTEVTLITPRENNSHQELNANSSQVSSVEVLYDRNRGNNRKLPSSQLNL